METHRIVLVTGASRGIGRAIVMELVRQGVQPVLTATSQAVLDELADTIASETGRRPLAVAADLTEETAIANLVDAVARVHGRLDGLVNNAGVTFSGKIEQTPTEAWDRCMVINARGPFILCRRGLPLLRKAEDPCIINISSVVGVKGYANQTAYTASKHALRGFSIALAEELHPEGIRVHVICPGGVDTDLVRRVRPDIPADELIQPQEIAQWTVFLLTRQGRGVVDEIHIRRTSSPPWF